MIRRGLLAFLMSVTSLTAIAQKEIADAVKDTDLLSRGSCVGQAMAARAAAWQQARGKSTSEVVKNLEDEFRRPLSNREKDWVNWAFEQKLPPDEADAYASGFCHAWVDVANKCLQNRKAN